MTKVIDIWPGYLAWIFSLDIWPGYLASCPIAVNISTAMKAVAGYKSQCLGRLQRLR